MTRIIAVLITLAAIGCNRNQMSGTESPPAEPEPVNAPADRPMAADIPADKTEMNQRDLRTETLTPMDQSESASDRTITQQARQGIVKADELSVSGKNIKIITNAGVVTLRGPVESTREKQEIANIVKHVDGVKRIETSRTTEVVLAQARSAQWNRDGGQFIPHPRTWLHQGRWQDEVERGSIRPAKPGLTGAIPVEKRAGDGVTGGTVNYASATAYGTSPTSTLTVSGANTV